MPQIIIGSPSETDLNLGCPQEAARDGHFGAYLLPQKDWPLVQDIGNQSCYLHVGCFLC